MSRYTISDRTVIIFHLLWLSQLGLSIGIRCFIYAPLPLKERVVFVEAQMYLNGKLHVRLDKQSFGEIFVGNAAYYITVSS